MKSTVMLALGLLIGGNVFSALYDVSIKWLPDEASAATFLLVRQVTSIMMLLPLWFVLGKPKSCHVKLHLVRANIGAVGALLLIMGLMSLPLATVSSLFYTAPLMIVLMGALFLKERIGLISSISSVLGFLGILIILRPSEMNLFGILVLAAALTFAINQLLLKKLSGSESPVVTLILYNLLSVPLVLILVSYQGISGLSWTLVSIAVVSNFFLLLYQWLSVLAYRRAKASEVAIAEYTGLVFCVFFGWLWFAEWLDGLSWLGAGFIVLPSLLLPWLFSGVSKRQVTARIGQFYPSHRMIKRVRLER
ncbi:putative permease [Shewanella psychrophila]|uniref:Putative permease n=1 Tax=Shewanella psychrophila TaxID=225848 RepID=A0A1S6HY85_9GAMM|nr:DMT family transporter [Shewanella psychrophila]AQS40469.1 putative permease [Shewanella psychrophila]